MLVGWPGKGKKGKKGGGGGVSASAELEVYHGELPCGYHNATIAGLSLISSALDKRRRKGLLGKAIVVGLGGGGLPMFLHKYETFTLPFLSRYSVVLWFNSNLFKCAVYWQ